LKEANLLKKKVKLRNDRERRKLIKAIGRKYSVEKEVDKSLEQKFIGRNSSDISDVVVDLILCNKSMEQEYRKLKEVVDHIQRFGCLEVDTATWDLIILVTEGGEGYSSCNVLSTESAHGGYSYYNCVIAHNNVYTGKKFESKAVAIWIDKKSGEGLSLILSMLMDNIRIKYNYLINSF
jgi:hypothetical protein